MTGFPLDHGFIVKPVGAAVPKAIFDGRRGRFVVYLYSSARDAEELVKTSGPVDLVRGWKRTMLRDANVVVIVEPPRRDLEHRIRQILRSL